MRKVLLTALLVVLALASQAQAHFGMVVPDRNLVTKGGPKAMDLDIRFWHPMENQGMNMEKPRLEVFATGGKRDVSALLAPVSIDGKQAWRARFETKAPGVCVFAVTPQPYWESAEGKYIQHLSKTVVDVLGDEDGWDRPVGQKIEIVPMAKPFALYAGNTFTGRALYKGKPLANADVEIEFFNKDGAVKAPDEAYATQAVKTDANGVFTYAPAWAGWWGFAALVEDDVRLKKDGKDKPVELGGIIWVYFHPVPGK